MKFADLKDDTAQDLGKYVDRLRAEVAFAQQRYLLPPGNNDHESVGENEVPPSLLEGFQNPEDFTVREQTLNYSNGDVYKGETLGKLRHGRGTHTSSNGDVYEGQWRYDKRHGRGKVVLHSGVQYEGEWRDDLAHGEGVARYENGGVYIGAFEAEKRCGWGTHYFPDRSKYEGEWRGDVMEGKGRHTYTDGSFFEGEFQQGRRVKGKLVAGDGASEYSGGWRDLQRHGYGVQFERGRYKYMGQWEADLQQGEGKCVYADGAQYDGGWQAGMRYGRGKLKAGHYQYEGEWQQDRQQGAGTCQTEAGDRYTGEFVEGKRHGKGRCIYSDGSKYEGEWQNDVRHGQGTCLFASGNKYQGEWHSDKRHGQGVCKFADGRKFKGEWEDDGWVQSAADPQHCRVAGPGVTKAVAGQKAELVIEARDDAGCKRLSGGDDFQAALWGPAPGSGTLGGSGCDASASQGMAAVTAEVKDNEDGSYSISYTATVAGVYELHITLGDEHVAHSPYPLRVLPARPSVRRSRVSGPGRSAALAGSPAHFTVAACDEYNNRWFGEPSQLRQLLPLEAKLTGGSGEEVAAQLEVTREGSFLCTYTVPSPGFWRLHIECAGQALPGAPFSVLAADPATAALEAPARAAAADEGQEGDAQPATEDDATDSAPALHEVPQPAGAAAAAAAAAATAASTATAAAPIRDEMRVWECIAAAAFAEADGSMEGWDSDSDKPRETKEDKYIRENPDVPVVENLEDLWMVSRLQRERKTKEEAEKARRLQGMRKQLEQAFGPAQPPTENEVMAAVKEIMRKEAGAPLLAPSDPTAPTLSSGGSGTSELTNGDAPSLAEAAPAATAPLGPVLRSTGRAGLRAAAAALAALD